MDLEQQLQELIQQAPQDGTTPAVVAAIAPVLKALAQRLRHDQYYIVQTIDQSWAVTTLSSQEQPEVEKTVIYAFPSLKDVSAGPYPMQDPRMIAIPIPVTHILFQMLAMEGIYSTIFFETPGNQAIGTEIQRQEINHLIEMHLQQLQTAPGSIVPPDIA
jgi:hypothetical protein